MATRARKARLSPQKTWLVPKACPEVRPLGPLRKAVLYTFMGGIVATRAVTSLGSRARSWLQKSTMKLRFGESYQQQSMELSSDQGGDKAHGSTKELDQKVAISAVALGLSTVGTLVYAPFSLLSLPAMLYVFSDFLKNAYGSLVKERKLNMDVLYVIIIPTCTALGYFLTANFQLFLLMYNRKLTSQIRNQSESSVVDVFRQQPQHVWLLVDGTEVEVPFETIEAGDTVVVDAGGMIPVDGQITAGVAAVDQHILTGEAQPVDRGVGDYVYASTVVLSGKIHIEVEKAGQETIVAHIGEVLNQTINVKTESQLRVESVSNRTVGPTLLMGGASLPFIGPMGSLALLSAHPRYKTTIATYIGILYFLETAAKNGVLIKDGRVFERLNTIDTIVFDKTGTLTEEQPHIGQFHLCPGYEENDILLYAAMAETKQTHPIAIAILQEAEARQLHVPEIDEAAYTLGYGLTVKTGQRLLHVGSLRFMEMEGIFISADMRQAQETCHQQGYSLVLVAVDEAVAGAIEFHATVRPEAPDVVSGLRHRNLQSLCIISGDHAQPTGKLAEHVGIDQYFAEVLPENKADLIKQFQEEGKTVCYIGDGINDAIALKQADVSISLRGASTVATDTAQVILMDQSLRQLCYLFDLAQNYDVNIKTTLRLIIAPALISASGALLLHFGLLSSILINEIGFIMAVCNSVWPRMRNQLPEPDALDFVKSVQLDRTVNLSPPPGEAGDSQDAGDMDDDAEVYDVDAARPLIP